MATRGSNMSFVCNLSMACKVQASRSKIPLVSPVHEGDALIQVGQKVIEALCGGQLLEPASRRRGWQQRWCLGTLEKHIGAQRWHSIAPTAQCGYYRLNYGITLGPTHGLMKEMRAGPLRTSPSSSLNGGTLSAAHSMLKLLPSDWCCKLLAQLKPEYSSCSASHADPSGTHLNLRLNTMLQMLPEPAHQDCYSAAID